MSQRKFPFVPKSSVKLKPGDFWSIPVDGSLYACGRVVDLWPSDYKGSRTGFLAGLLDWSSKQQPTEESIAGAQTIQQGGVHYKTILITGGEILGNRSLELDDISPQLFIEYPDNKTPYIYKGLHPVRPAKPEEVEQYSTVSIFGHQYLSERANYLFGNHNPKV